jgi:hypothetical protein
LRFLADFLAQFVADFLADFMPDFLPGLGDLTLDMLDSLGLSPLNWFERFGHRANEFVTQRAPELGCPQ